MPKLSTTKAGAAITFSSVGSGDKHRLEMFKKNEKSLITINDVIQSPVSFTPIQQHYLVMLVDKFLYQLQ